jgi:GNAT superfamily N-acetyltransferase
VCENEPDNGKLCGWLQAHASHVIESGFRVEIVGLVVADDARRKGIGRQLVARAEQWATGIGAKTSNVRSNVLRQEAHLFYPSLGYHLKKTQAAYRKELK